MKRLKSGSSGSRTGAILNKRIIYMKKDGSFLASVLIFYLSFEEFIHISPPDCDAWWAPQIFVADLDAGTSLRLCGVYVLMGLTGIIF